MQQCGGCRLSTMYVYPYELFKICMEVCLWIMYECTIKLLKGWVSIFNYNYRGISGFLKLGASSNAV